VWKIPAEALAAGIKPRSKKQEEPPHKRRRKPDSRVPENNKY
jgi:hypothetical protein